MSKLNYCIDCKRILGEGSECTYCNSKNTKSLNMKSPVNVIGTKIKGRVQKMDSDAVQILVVGEGNSKSLKSYGLDKLRKVL